MDDDSGFRDRPEAVAKHQQVRNKEKHGYPDQWRDSDGGTIGAGEHQRRSFLLLSLLLSSLLLSDLRTGTASAAENSNSSGALELGRSRLAVRMVRMSPPSVSTCSKSVAPWKA